MAEVMWGNHAANIKGMFNLKLKASWELFLIEVFILGNFDFFGKQKATQLMRPFFQATLQYNCYQDLKPLTFKETVSYDISHLKF